VKNHSHHQIKNALLNYCYPPRSIPMCKTGHAKSCIVPWTNNSFSNRSFGAAGPHVWNSLSSYLWQHIS